MNCTTGAARQCTRGLGSPAGTPTTVGAGGSSKRGRKITTGAGAAIRKTSSSPRCCRAPIATTTTQAAGLLIHNIHGRQEIHSSSSRSRRASLQGSSPAAAARWRESLRLIGVTKTGGGRESAPGTSPARVGSPCRSRRCRRPRRFSRRRMRRRNRKRGGGNGGLGSSRREHPADVDHASQHVAGAVGGSAVARSAKARLPRARRLAARGVLDVYHVG